jgi:nudix-type nucleoside diphosphatase (YffH/AdpP family)
VTALAALRRGWHGGGMDAAITADELVYDGWVNLHRLQVRMPDGAQVERHLVRQRGAAGVLPYDPERRVALLVSQPRAPVMAAGGGDLMEVIAGLDDGDPPEEAARREAMEEAGVRLGALEPVALIWSLPTLSSERVALFLAPYRAADRVAAGGGAAGEGECITVHELPLAALAAEVRAGALTDAKTLVCAQALMLRRPELFA